MVKDGRAVSGVHDKVWSKMTRDEKRATVGGAQPINKNGSRASKEQVEQRRRGSK
jgi:hypothetical protein